MKKNDTKTPFKLEILGFKLDTSINGGISIYHVVFIIAMVLSIYSLLFFLIRGNAVMGFIGYKISQLNFFKIIKSKFF